MKGPNWPNAFVTLTRDLSVLRSELYPRCSSSIVMAATTAQKTLPSDFVLSLLQTAVAKYRFKSLPATTSWTKCAIDRI